MGHSPGRFLLWLAAVLLAGLPGLPARAANESSAVPELLLANVYRAGIDVRDYWVSEKLDGVRAYWDGQSLRFRSGQPVNPPAWFTARWPAQPLDGELWIGRGRFDELSAIVRKLDAVDADWRPVRYMVFELPGADGSFTQRLGHLKVLLEQAGVPWLQAVEQTRVDGHAALMTRMTSVVAGGGEGLMLHLAEAPYSTGRSDVLLKLKPWLDAEARVVAHIPGRGKYRGLLGALEVERPDGRRFRLGTGFNDAQRRSPPAIGARVTYRYRELTPGGLPRFPVFLRVRDLD